MLKKEFTLLEGSVSLLFAGLFFICQIVQAADSANALSATTSTATLTVMMKKTAVTEIERGAQGVLLVAAELFNQSAQDINVEQVNISGVFSPANESNTVLYIDGARAGAPKIVTDTAVGYGLALKIPAGKSVLLTLKGDFPSTGTLSPVTYYFTPNIYAYGADGTRAHVVMGGTAGASGLNLRPSGSTVSTSYDIKLVTEKLSARKGEKNVVLQRLELKNYDDQVGLVMIEGFDIVSTGSYLADPKLDAAYLYLGDKLIAVGTVDVNRISFGKVVSLSAGANATLTLKGDISSQATSRTLVFKLDWDYNVYYGGVIVHSPINLTGDASMVSLSATSEGAVEQAGTSSETQPVACHDGSGAIKQGALIRLKGGIDVYIVKYSGCKRYKRLILSPAVFSFYGHLRWEDIVDVDQATLDSYAASKYVRAGRENAIWRLEADGDSGVRRRLNITSRWDDLTETITYNYDPDSVYEINDKDRDLYSLGTDIDK